MNRKISSFTWWSIRKTEIVRRFLWRLNTDLTKAKETLQAQSSLIQKEITTSAYVLSKTYPSGVWRHTYILNHRLSTAIHLKEEVQEVPAFHHALKDAEGKWITHSTGALQEKKVQEDEEPGSLYKYGKGLLETPVSHIFRGAYESGNERLLTWTARSASAARVLLKLHNRGVRFSLLLLGYGLSRDSNYWHGNKLYPAPANWNSVKGVG